MDYITPPVDPSDDDPVAISGDILSYLGQRFPGLDPAAGSFLRALAEGIGQEHAETRRSIKDVMDYVAAVLGQSMFLVPAQNAVSATAPSTWTMPDTAGYLIPAGTEVSLLAPDGTRVGFEVAADATVPAGQSATATGGVTLIAVEPGTDGNDLSDSPLLEDGRLDFAPASIVVTAPSAGGLDAESMTEYLSRFARLRPLVRRLVIPEDFEAAAREYAGVRRAIAVNGYNPDDGTSGNVDHLTVVAVGDDGLPVSSTIKDAMLADFQANTILGGIIHMADATYTTINVVFAATCYPGYLPATVEAAAEAAVLDFLNPANFGLAPFGDQPVFYAEPVVSRGDIYGVLERVEGLRRVTSLIINGSATDDAPLPGNPGLPSTSSTASGTITGT